MTLEARQFTYHTRLSLTPTQIEFLEDYAQLWNTIERRLFADYSRGENILKLKSAYLRKYQITARQFNAIRISLQGRIASIAARMKDRIENIKFLIKKHTKTVRYLSRLKSPNFKQANALHQKKRALIRSEQKLIQLQSDQSNHKIRICFGSKKIFRQQFHLSKTNLRDFSDWKKQWKFLRNQQFTLVGSKDETMGNQSCIISQDSDSRFGLKVRVPDYLIPKYGKYMVFDHITYPYGQREISAAIFENQTRQKLGQKKSKQIHGDQYQSHGQAMTYRFLRDKNGQGCRLFITFEQKPPVSKTDEHLGVIGIDINADHLAVSETEQSGNLVSHHRLNYNLYGKSHDQCLAIIGDLVKAVVNFAQLKQKSIVIEQLDFTAKKRALLQKKSHAKRNRQLSSFCYALIINYLKSRAFKCGVKIHSVNPAYSSIIGRIKFARQYPISVHVSAAWVIARRLMRFSERLPRFWHNIPGNTGERVTLSGLVKIQHKHVWSSWANVQKTFQKTVHVEHIQKFRTAQCAVATGEEIPF